MRAFRHRALAAALLGGCLLAEPAPATEAKVAAPSAHSAAPAPEAKTAPREGARPPIAAVLLSVAPRGERVPPTRGKKALVWGPWDGGGWADVYREASEESERVAQGLLGDEVTIEEVRDGWVRGEEASAGLWRGWLRSTHLTGVPPSSVGGWERNDRMVLVRAPAIEVAGATLMLPFGAILPVVGVPANDSVTLLLPDGRRLRVAATDVAPAAARRPLQFAVEHARGLVRKLPYQGGGNSPEAVDATGLVYLLLRVSGVPAPREPEALRSAGELIAAADRRPGDVLFFEMFGQNPLHPAVLNGDHSVFEASQASGPNYQLLGQLEQRQLVEVRRFLAPGVVLDARSNSPAQRVSGWRNKRISVEVAAIALTHQLVLLAFIVALRSDWNPLEPS